MCARLEEIAGATGDIEGTGALIIDQPEEFWIYSEKNISDNLRFSLIFFILILEHNFGRSISFYQ